MVEFRWVFKNGLLPIGPKWADSELLETELQSYRVTTKGTQYTGGENIFVPDFNQLPYSLRSQGDKVNILSEYQAEKSDPTWKYYLPTCFCQATFILTN